MTSPTRILHVCEAWGGGVVSAVTDYTRSAPEFEHHLLAAARTRHATGESTESFATHQSWRRTPIGALNDVRAAIARVRPHIIHAHSTGAGLVRMLNIAPLPVVYTPHCFIFERRDLPQPVLRFLRGCEALLARRTSAFAACSPREAALAADLCRSVRSPCPISHVPNIGPGSYKRQAGAGWRGSGKLQIVGVGRLSPQKDPAFFIQVVEACAEGQLPVSFVWAGGGDSDTVRAVTNSGANVTGWISRDGVSRLMNNSDLYLHTAAWEGAPMTLLEAAHVGLPIVARSIPALRALDWPDQGRTPSEIAATIERLVSSPDELLGLADQSQALASRHTPELQRAALLSVYSAALARVESNKVSEEGD